MATAVVDGARLPLIVSRLLVAAMLAAGCGVVASGSGSVTVPMQMLNTMTLVSVQVNGSPYHALFLLDTGANLTVLNPLYAGRLGIVVPDNARKKTIRAVGGAALTIPLVKVPRLAVGDAAVENMRLAIVCSPAIVVELGISLVSASSTAASALIIPAPAPTK